MYFDGHWRVLLDRFTWSSLYRLAENFLIFFRTKKTKKKHQVEQLSADFRSLQDRPVADICIKVMTRDGWTGLVVGWLATPVCSDRR